MRLYLLAVGVKMPAWIEHAFQDYAKRLPRDCALELIEIKPEKRVGGKTAVQIKAAERIRIEAQLPKNCQLIALDERGIEPTTAQLSQWLGQWQHSGQDVALVIGGADGLDDELKQRAQRLLALSKLTLPHGMVRVLLAEQLYRAWSLQHNHPYHRE